MAGRKRPPADAAAATGGADRSNEQTASSSKTGARSPAQRPTRSRSQTKAKAGANFADGNGNGDITSSLTPSVEPTVSRTHDQPLSEAEVRARAYEIYLSRGGADGDPVADWLAAERQVLRKGGQTS